MYLTFVTFVSLFSKEQSSDVLIHHINYSVCFYIYNPEATQINLKGFRGALQLFPTDFDPLAPDISSVCASFGGFKFSLAVSDDGNGRIVISSERVILAFKMPEAGHISRFRTFGAFGHF